MVRCYHKENACGPTSSKKARYGKLLEPQGPEKQLSAKLVAAYMQQCHAARAASQEICLGAFLAEAQIVQLGLSLKRPIIQTTEDAQ